MARFVSASSRETQRIARKLLHRFAAKPTRPLIFALAGELGSGKTTFVQGLARALGIREKVQSPTFVLVKWYRLGRRAKPFRHFVHVDAYRLEKQSETRHLGLRDVFKDRDAVVAVEWADRIRKVMPRDAVWIRFRHGRRSSERIVELIKRVK